MAEDKDNISRAKAQLEEAQTNLVEAYLARIREGYQTLESRQKEFVLGGLDALVNNIENGSFIQPIANSSERNSVRKNLAYDPEMAEEVRKKAGLNVTELAKELGFSKSAYVQLIRYESGEIKPSNPPRGKTSKAYMAWLKEQGYDPFNL